MKNIVLSAVAVLAMSSFAVAGGDIAPVEEPVVVPEPVVTDSGFYLGLAYGWENLDATYTEQNIVDPTNGRLGAASFGADEDYSSIMLQAGYKFNSYVAVEGRYWIGLDSDYTLNGVDSTSNIDSWGIYVKPMYPVTDAFDIYALLGYADTTLNYQNNTVGGIDYDPYGNGGSVDGFSWGIGAAYSFTDNFAVFVDYVSLYSDSEDFISVRNNDATIDYDLTAINFGLTYQF